MYENIDIDTNIDIDVDVDSVDKVNAWNHYIFTYWRLILEKISLKYSTINKKVFQQIFIFK